MTTTKQQFKIEGMHCASCAVNIENTLKKKTGVKDAAVNYANEKAYVEYDTDKVAPKHLAEAVKNAGNYHLVMPDEEHNGGHMHHDAKSRRAFGLFLFSFVLTLPLLFNMVVPPNSGEADYVLLASAVASFIVVFIFGWQFHKGMLIQLKHVRADMDSLISLGTIAAYGYSLYALAIGKEVYFETAAVIITLVLLGRYLEAKSKGQASKAIQKLLALGVKKARVIVGAETKEMEISAVRVGDILLIKPGEKIPLDSEIIEGQTAVDEAVVVLTGAFDGY